MQDRVEAQLVLRPQPGRGQRIAIGAGSTRSAELTRWKEYHIWASKACWIRTGNATVVATQPGGGPPETGGSFPLPAGAVYTYTAIRTTDTYIAVIEDASVNGIAGYLFIGQAEV